MSAERSDADLAGVFEFDGETSYFYLYRTAKNREQVLDAIHVFSGIPDFSEADIAVRWNPAQDKVGLFIRDELWAVFDTHTQLRMGGDYEHGDATRVPLDVVNEFCRN